MTGTRRETAPWMHRLARLLICGTVLAASGAAAQQRDPDPWFGRDKALHFGLSAGLAGAGYAGASLFFDREPERLLLGGGFAFGAGIAKELYDLTGRGDPSWKDLTWDALGTATGLAFSWALDHFVISPLLRKPEVRPSPATARLRWIPDGPFTFRTR